MHIVKVISSLITWATIKIHILGLTQNLMQQMGGELQEPRFK